MSSQPAVPDATGHFGQYGGMFVPETLMAPLQELAEEYDGKFNFTKLDVDANPQTAMNFGIRSIPTLLLFKDGKVAEQVVGAVPKAVLKRKIDKVLED